MFFISYLPTIHRFIFCFLVMAFLTLQLIPATRADHITHITIDGLVCDFCAQALEKLFSARDEVKEINVDLGTKIVTVEYSGTERIDDQTLTQLVVNSGYSVRNIHHHNHE